MATERMSSKGCFVISAPGGRLYIETSKMRALELAVYTGGDVKFVLWGQAVDEADVMSFEPKGSKPTSRIVTQELDA